MRLRGLNQRHIAIVGAGTLGRTVAARLAQAPWAGFSIVRVLRRRPAQPRARRRGRPGGGPTDELLRATSPPARIDQVWIALPLRAEARIREILTMLREHSVEVRFVPDIYGFHLLNHSVTEVGGLPVISLTETPMSGINRVVKAIEDYVLAHRPAARSRRR